jgi:hypothetical protein
MAEIDEKSHPLFSGAEVVHELSPMGVFKVFAGFDFQDHLVEADEVGLVAFAEDATLVVELQRRHGNERDSPVREFEFQAFLINIL